MFYSFIVSPISEENVPGEKWGSAGGGGREEKDVLEMERANHSSNSNSSNAGSRKDSFD